MKDEIVVYRSISGFTQQYAQWIAEELECECIPYESMDYATLRKYKRVIIGGCVRYEKLDNAKAIGKMIRELPDVVLFIVGATPMTDRFSTGYMLRKTYRQSPHFKYVPHFYFQGGVRIERLCRRERILLKIMARIIELGPIFNQDMKAAARRMRSSADFSNRENIGALVEYVKAGRDFPIEA